MDTHTQHISKILSENTQQTEIETDQTVKTMKLLITDELQKVEKSMASNIRFMVEQLQQEVRQDIRAIELNFQKSHDELTKSLSDIQAVQLNFQKSYDDFVKDSQTERIPDKAKKVLEINEPQVTVDLQKGTEPSLSSVNTSSTIHAGAVKSDHLKLTFPTFGRPSDDSDPLLYLTKCKDFLALHPLSDPEILATFRTVLYGTARDWWEVARTTITTWSEFESSFRIAFLSEDYEDELAERVRIRTQGERESVRDFAFTYRALCKRWKPTLTEPELVKMILKNIKPYLASQLRGRVSNVEEMVRLGQQLEKDRLQQMQFDYRQNTRHGQTGLQGLSVTQLPDKPLVQCWRCKGHHAPGSCPQFTLSLQTNSPSTQNTTKTQPTFHSKSRGKPIYKSVATVTSSHEKVKSPYGQKFSIVPQQLIVPVQIETWIGKAIVDTGASYTLIHESLWKCLDLAENNLRPWNLGPLYLANGKAEIPLGWLNVSLQLHEQICPLPVVVLPKMPLLILLYWD